MTGLHYRDGSRLYYGDGSPLHSNIQLQQNIQTSTTSIPIKHHIRQPSHKSAGPSQNDKSIVHQAKILLKDARNERHERKQLTAQRTISHPTNIQQHQIDTNKHTKRKVSPPAVNRYSIDRNKAASHIQRVSRGRSIRRNKTIQNNAASRIQSHIRMRRYRKVYEDRLEEFYTKQCKWRAMSGKGTVQGHTGWYRDPNTNNVSYFIVDNDNKWNQFIGPMELLMLYTTKLLPMKDTISGEAGWYMNSTDSTVSLYHPDFDTGELNMLIGPYSPTIYRTIITPHNPGRLLPISGTGDDCNGWYVDVTNDRIGYYNVHNNKSSNKQYELMLGPYTHEVYVTLVQQLKDEGDAATTMQAVVRGGIARINTDNSAHRFTHSDKQREEHLLLADEMRIRHNKTTNKDEQTWFNMESSACKHNHVYVPTGACLQGEDGWYMEVFTGQFYYLHYGNNFDPVIWIGPTAAQGKKDFTNMMLKQDDQSADNNS